MNKWTNELISLGFLICKDYGGHILSFTVSSVAQKYNMVWTRGRDWVKRNWCQLKVIDILILICNKLKMFSYHSLNNKSNSDLLSHYSLMPWKLLSYNKFIYYRKISVPGNISMPTSKQQEAQLLLMCHSSWPMNNTGLDGTGALIYRVFSINIFEKILEICDNLKRLTNKPCSLEIVKKKKLGMSWMYKIYIDTSILYQLIL